MFWKEGGDTKYRAKVSFRTNSLNKCLLHYLVTCILALTQDDTLIIIIIMIINIAMHVCVSQSLSHVWLFVTPWTAAHQAPLSMRFSRQGYWSGLPFPSLGDLPNPGVKPGSPALPADPLLTELRVSMYTNLQFTMTFQIYHFYQYGTTIKVGIVTYFLLVRKLTLVLLYK